jgi:predicted RNA-binding Zn-ribbon protein involved in translation (DUF1610 family)
MPDAVVHGPYLDKGLDRMIVNVQRGSRRGNMTYARFLMQEHLQRVLGPDEHVDHRNENHLDDRIENLQLLTPAANIRKTRGEITYFEFSCPQCGNPGIQNARHVRSNRKKGRAGPFCGRSCAGKYKAPVLKLADRQP